MASIHLEHVSVSFPVYASATRSIKNRLFRTATGGQIRRTDQSHKILRVQALQDINLDLKDGDRIGLVGHNGAGKTTLLRVLAKIYEPNEGNIAIRGKVVPLFDIRLGMDPESTGYENILLRGLYLGLSRNQISSLIDDIAEFTELGDFLNLPIRTYSAGMQMRLAFAVSTSVPPDILLLDEGIGVGDAAFLEKASERLKLFTERVSIIVLSSHSESLIRQMCNKAVLLEHGQTISAGTTCHVLEQYRQIREGTLNSPPPVADLPISRTVTSPIAETNIPASTQKIDTTQFSDTALWATQTILLLQEHRWAELDFDRLITQLERLSLCPTNNAILNLLDSGSYNKINVLITNLISNLTILYFLPEATNELHKKNINQIRSRIRNEIQADPMLSSYLPITLEKCYPIGIDLASDQLTFKPTDLPQSCPVDLPTLLNDDWFPPSNQ